jgi:hypothetical protein
MKCPICEGEGEHHKTGGLFSRTLGVTVEDWRAVYEMMKRHDQEMLALIHSIMARIAEEKANA